MKKCILFLALCLLMVGCGDKKPSGISDEMYDSAVYVIKVVDSYLDGEAELDETYNKISNLNIPEYTDIADDDATVYTSIFSLKITLFGMNPDIGTQTISDLKEKRNELAEKINY